MRKLTTAAVLTFLLATTFAHADVLATSTRQTFPTSVTTAVNNLPLNDAGATSLTFTTATTQTVLITFSTDCSVATAGNVLAVVIYVDGIAAAGTGASSAGSRMCSSNLISAASRTAFITVGPGTHTVQITGQIIGSGTGGFLRTVTAVQN
ncbi:MAG TPA: hypothetical protein VF266_00365 [Thermoanaerobaculia bacterium]